MKLDKHIGYKFLTEEKFTIDILMHYFQDAVDEEEFKNSTEFRSTASLLHHKENKNYYITSTVIEKLDLLKVKQKELKGKMQFDWTYFNSIEPQKITFLTSTNSAIRFWFTGTHISIFFLQELSKGEMKSRGTQDNVWFDFCFVDKRDGTYHPPTFKEGETDEHKEQYERFIYSLLCFFFLSENELVIVEPNRKYGTKKSGKVVNSLPFPITVVNSNWNVTSIRVESFGVAGHFALRWTGQGRRIPKMVFIEPYEKGGYVRKAQKK